MRTEEILKERAEKYYNYAKRFFKEEDYDSSAFYTEQAIQMFLKYLLLKNTGAFPKTHDLEELFLTLGKIYPEILEFYRENAGILLEIYFAYFNSRYAPKKYNKEAVEKYLVVLDKFYDFIKRWL